MALYLSYEVSLPSQKILAAEWSNTDIPVLGVSTSKKKITFFQDEGINISEHDLKNEKLITALTWHPSEMILAYGSDSGYVGVWIDESNTTKEEFNHDGKVTIIKFNNEGNRIISIDDKGMINVWRFPPLSNMCQYKQSYSITELVIPSFNIEKMNKDKTPSADKLSTLFFFSNSGGILHLADDANSCPEICRTGGKIKSVLFYERENAIILITSNLLLVKCVIHFSQKLIPKKVKLSIAGKPDEIQCCWASEGLIAIVSGDDIVRFFYLDTDQSYMISISDHPLGSINTEDSFSCLDFSSKRRVLIVGGVKGKVYMWKCNLTTNIIPISADAWEPFCVVDTIPGIISLKWSLHMGLIHVRAHKGKHAMLSETILQKKMNEKMKILQISQKEIEIITNSDGTYISKKIELNDNTKGIAIFSNNLLCWNGNKAILYNVDLGTFKLNTITTLNIQSNLMSLNDDTVIVANNRSKAIELYSYEGELKDSFTMNSRHSEIMIFNTFSKYLLVCTSENYFGVYDITRRNLKLILEFRKFEKNGIKLGEIRDASINLTGNVIIFVIDNMINSDMRAPETKFVIFDIEMDSFIDYEISPNRIPVEVICDYSDSRIFGIYTEYAKDFSEEGKNDLYNIDDPLVKEKSEWFGPEFFVCFYSSENGVHHIESHKINREYQGVFGLDIPNVFFISSMTDPVTKSSITEKKFQFFHGLENLDETTKHSLIEFTILMSCGKLDEAYKIVKNIKSGNIWENMAHICIKTKRLDVLEVCLSNMRFERGIRAFREARHEKEPEAKLAMVAMHLNMIDEAKELLQECNRWDVLIHFYITIGEYEQAVNTAKENDRINLQNTYFRIAQHYEQIDDIDEAMKYYKLSNCDSREIPRMLISKNKIELLEKSLSDSNNNVSLLWWASYLESKGDFDKALETYKKAKDSTNIIRLLLKKDKLEEAIKEYEKEKEIDGAYLIGNYYEKNKDIKKAIVYYGTSGRINQAFRIAKENNLDNDISALGMKAPKNTQNLIAEYFEEKGQIERAIELYLLGSNIRKGLNLCLATNQYDKVREISETLESQQDKDTLKALAEYFIEQQQHEKALGLYIRIKDYETAMKLCENYKVRISTETANAILSDLNQEKDNKIKQQLTSRLAKLLMSQGDFDIAHDIYVKIGNLKKAMKCCIKQGNKNKVIEFAHMARMPELYILAANFLENLEWTNDIVKIIVSFFTKAKAYYNLANFYKVFASIDIQEKQNYKQAEELYKEAIKVVQKVRENDEKKDNTLKDLNEKYEIVHRINEIGKKMTNGEFENAIKICNELLSRNDISEIISEKNLFTLKFKIYYSMKDHQNAYIVLCEGRDKGFKKLGSEAFIAETLKNVGKSNELETFMK